MMMTKTNLLKLRTIFFAVLFTCTSVCGQDVNIIPYPNKVEMLPGTFNLSKAGNIYYVGNTKDEALLLQAILKNEHQLELPVLAQSAHSTIGNIYVALSPITLSKLGKEAYALLANKDQIALQGSSKAGLFYGIQTLRQLIRNEANNKVVPCIKITDKPRFGWRAFMLDEGRYFKGAKVVKDLLDEMALLKMNTFHWHLTDDGGWRIEIKKYPKLTEVGSKRRMSELGTWLSNVFDSVPHSGFYTQEEIKDIVKYAADRHITIIPEIEMPGHSSAAIASYPWLGTENKKIEVPISFGIKQDVFNVANPRVRQFLRDVLDEVMALFPSKVIHIGGDEVKFDQWKASAEVQAYMKKNNIKTPADLQIEFTNGISNFLQQRGHRMIGWNDILGGLHGNNDSLDASVKSKLSETTIIQFWTGDPLIVNKAAEKGYDVVNSYWEYTYLDYDYKTTNLEKAYRFDPVFDSLPPALHNKVLGLGCQMWGEWIPTVERMNYLVYPRIAAFAETGWTDKSGKDFKKFSTILKNSYHMKRWEKRGIKFSPEQF